MTVSPGTGAGIGIAIGLLVLFIAGPVAYRYNKRRRIQQVNSPPENQLEAGEKPQLDGTPLSPSIWRNSNRASSIHSRSDVVQPDLEHGLGISGQPISEAGGSEIGEVDSRQLPAEISALNERNRAEFDIDIQSPYVGHRAELRSDALTPPESSKPNTLPTIPEPMHAQKAEQLPRQDSGESGDLPQLPILPGPVLPPKVRK
jgi:hypothetical protein